MARINLDNFLIRDRYVYYSKEYQTLKRMLLMEKEELKQLEFELDQVEDKDKLFEEYLLTQGEELYMFLYKHPLFNKYITQYFKIYELAGNILELADNLKLDNIRLFRDCTHVFGIIDNKVECLNCTLNERDMNIYNEDELDTFKDIIKLRHRFVGKILDEEYAYKSVIYEQRLEEIKRKGLKR